jgi:hypothetical protein
MLRIIGYASVGLRRAYVYQFRADNGTGDLHAIGVQVNHFRGKQTHRRRVNRFPHDFCAPRHR